MLAQLLRPYAPRLAAGLHGTRQLSKMPPCPPCGKRASASPPEKDMEDDRAMNRNFVALFLLVLATGCATSPERRAEDPVPPDLRLAGTFQSDKEATLEYLRSTGAYSAEKLEELDASLGKLRVTYTRNYIRSVFDGQTNQGPFKLVEVTSQYALIETTVPPRNTPVRYRLTFTADGYWLSEGILPLGFKEKFVRLPHPPAAAPGQPAPR